MNVPEDRTGQIEECTVDELDADIKQEMQEAHQQNLDVKVKEISSEEADILEKKAMGKKDASSILAKLRAAHKAKIQKKKNRKLAIQQSRTTIATKKRRTANKKAKKNKAKNRK